jgi:hypothetical protein
MHRYYFCSNILLVKTFLDTGRSFTLSFIEIVLLKEFTSSNVVEVMKHVTCYLSEMEEWLFDDE